LKTLVECGPTVDSIIADLPQSALEIQTVSGSTSTTLASQSLCWATRTSGKLRLITLASLRALAVAMMEILGGRLPRIRDTWSGLSSLPVTM